MPTYEYSCTECGEHLEVVQSFRDDPLTECPNCHGLLRKVFSPIGIVLKGSGFYKTDNRSGGGTAVKTPVTAETSKTDSGGSGTSEKSTASDGKSSGGESKSSTVSAAAAS